VATRGRKALKASQTRPKAEAGLWEGFTVPGNLNAAAAAEFNRLVASLRRKGTLDHTDPKVVLNAAKVQAMLEENMEKLDDEGMLTESSNHTPMANPRMNIVNTLLMRINKLQNDMGLTATAKQSGGESTSGRKENGWGDLLDVAG
jgi:P27 family predicted phage terminase small subunit